MAGGNDTDTGTGPSADAVAERLLNSALGGMEILSVYLGDRLGWYRALRDGQPTTPSELAARTDTDARYAREWLEQQAVLGLVEVELVENDEDRFWLLAGAAEALTDVDSLAYLAPISRMIAAAGLRVNALTEAYRTGGGVSWEDFGADARESQADLNRPWFLQNLGSALRSVPELDEVLRRDGARLLDVGCGAGWSTIGLAEAYEQAQVDGVDIDRPSIEMAQNHLADHPAAAGRVTFRHAAGEELATDGAYDVAFAFECVHDMARPVEVLAAVRRALRPGGRLIVVDEAVADRFTGAGDEVEKLMYGFSTLICLPDGRSSTPSVATGTVMRPSTLDRYAREAGFTGASPLPIEGFGFLRFYELR